MESSDGAFCRHSVGHGDDNVSVLNKVFLQKVSSLGVTELAEGQACFQKGLQRPGSGVVPRTASSQLPLFFLLCLEPIYAFQELLGLKILLGGGPKFFHVTLESAVCRICVLRVKRESVYSLQPEVVVYCGVLSS